MGHLARALLQLLGMVLELRMRLLKLLLEVGAGGDVDDRGEDERTPPGAQRREADLHGELAAVAAARGQLQPAADGARSGVTAIGGARGDVALYSNARAQDPRSAAPELLGRPAEDLLDPRAGVDDATVSVDGEDRIGLA